MDDKVLDELSKEIVDAVLPAAQQALVSDFRVIAITIYCTQLHYLSTTQTATAEEFVSWKKRREEKKKKKRRKEKKTRKI